MIFFGLATLLDWLINCRMNFFGLMTFNAPYLPWVLLGFSLLLGNSISVDILGIFFLQPPTPYIRFFCWIREKNPNVIKRGKTCFLISNFSLNNAILKNIDPLKLFVLFFAEIGKIMICLGKKYQWRKPNDFILIY